MGAALQKIDTITEAEFFFISRKEDGIDDYVKCLEQTEENQISPACRNVESSEGQILKNPILGNIESRLSFLQAECVTYILESLIEGHVIL